MAIPSEKKERAIYHMILSEMHRLQGLMLNMQTVEVPEAEEALQEHYSRQQNLALGKLTEWRRRRPEVFREAEGDFRAQVQSEEEGT